MIGWSTPTAAAELLWIVLLLAGVVDAAEDVADTALPEGFLEFLADWEDEQGQWQDPLEYEDPQWQALDDRLGQGDE